MRLFDLRYRLKERGRGNIKKANPKVRLFKFLIWLFNLAGLLHTLPTH